MTTQASEQEHPGLGPGRNRLEGKVAIVTGANSGIGRATADLFAREGAKVVGVDFVEDIQPRIDNLIKGQGGECTFVNANVTNRADCDRMVATALNTYGDLHILVNNAGTGIRGRVDQLSAEQWGSVLDTNLNSVFNGSQAALPHMMEKGRGSIINTASTFGLLASEDYAAYCASKGGVVLLTRSMAIDYGPMGIRVNCVCPGATATPRLLRFFNSQPDPEAALAQAAKINRAVQRMGRPEEIAYGMLFLASDEASFVTGHALAVDGGQTIDA